MAKREFVVELRQHKVKEYILDDSNFTRVIGKAERYTYHEAKYNADRYNGRIVRIGAEG